MDKISILSELSNLIDISLILVCVFMSAIGLIAAFTETLSLKYELTNDFTKELSLKYELIVKKMYKIISFLLALSMSISLALWMIEDTSWLWKYQFFAGTGLLLLVLLFY